MTERRRRSATHDFPLRTADLTCRISLVHRASQASTLGGTEHLSDLCVDAPQATEDTEAVLTGGEIFARSEDTQP